MHVEAGDHDDDESRRERGGDQAADGGRVPERDGSLDAHERVALDRAVGELRDEQQPGAVDDGPAVERVAAKRRGVERAEREQDPDDRAGPPEGDRGGEGQDGRPARGGAGLPPGVGAGRGDGGERARAGDRGRPGG